MELKETGFGLDKYNSMFDLVFCWWSKLCFEGETLKINTQTSNNRMNNKLNLNKEQILDTT